MTSAWDRNPGVVGIETPGIETQECNPSGIETLWDTIHGKKRHQEDSNFRGRIPSRFLIYRLNHSAMVPTVEVLPGFEPGSPDSESEVLTSYTIRPGTPGGTRTHNLTLRRGTRYPLRYGGYDGIEHTSNDQVTISKKAPPVGIEPTTTRLRVLRSTI